MLIDPPTPFSPTKEWEEFAASMNRIKPQPWEIEFVRWAIEEAEQELKRRRNMSDEERRLYE